MIHINNNNILQVQKSNISALDQKRPYNTKIHILHKNYHFSTKIFKEHRKKLHTHN